MLRIATDGGCSPNPGPGGWAWVAEDGRYEAGAFPQGTNNIAELLAIRHALLAFPETPLEIQYDSQYAANCVTVWGPSWRRQGLTNKANIELIFSIIDVLELRPASAPITWTWVRGHDKTNRYPLNTAADKLASSMNAKRAHHHESGVMHINTSVTPARTRPGKVLVQARAETEPNPALAPAPQPPDGLVHCAHSGCTATHARHYWGNIHAQGAGWFSQTNGQDWCPDHTPGWVAAWRARKKQAISGNG